MLYLHLMLDLRFFSLVNMNGPQLIFVNISIDSLPCFDYTFSDMPDTGSIYRLKNVRDIRITKLNYWRT